MSFDDSTPITVYVAQSEVDGEQHQIVFDTYPSVSDVLNVCEDMERPIEVYAVTCSVANAELQFTVAD
jgi:hypothetical protein